MSTPNDDRTPDVRAALDARAAERAAGSNAIATEASEPAKAVTAPTEPDSKGAAAIDIDERKSQATRIIDFVHEAGVELWHTPKGDAFMTIPAGGHVEHHHLQSNAAREWLARLYYRSTRRSAGTQPIKDALNTLGGMARYEGSQHDVHVRLGGGPGCIYLDLGDADWRVVAITPEGWTVIDSSPVRFRRPAGMLALPTPQTGGSVDAVREVVHVERDEDWTLIVAWLVGVLRYGGPYPVLGLDGEQGSGKSTTAKMLRRLVDPNVADLRAEPRELRDLMIAASSGRVVALDNVSHLPAWLSDALCRISTGGAFSTRVLYSDGDEHLIEAVRPTIITGITPVITRGDLQDRTIAITLPAIPGNGRRSEAALWKDYDRVRPYALGALCDAASCALRRESGLDLPDLPRLADFATWVTAAEPALGYEDGVVLRALWNNSQQAIEQTLDGDPLAVAVRAMSLPYEGTAMDLLNRLPTPAYRARSWPETPRALAGMLRRLAPQLRRVGIQVEFLRRVADRRPIVIKALPEVSSRASAPSPSTESPLLVGDDNERADVPSHRNLLDSGPADGNDEDDEPSPRAKVLV